MAYQNFTSLPPDEERQFVIYEQTATESRKKAMTLGAIAGAVVGVFAIIIFLAYDAPRNAHAVDVPSELDEEVVPKPTPAPAPAAAAAPAELGADELGADEPAAAEADAPMEAPEPPAGATKAPPTDLIK